MLQRGKGWDSKEQWDRINGGRINTELDLAELLNASETGGADRAECDMSKEDKEDLLLMQIGPFPLSIDLGRVMVEKANGV